MAHEKYLQVLPEKFDGSGNFDDWVSNFECISAINGWNEREMALWLRAHVTGKAHVAYKCFSHEIQENFTQIKAALRERFEPSSKQAYYRIEFERREKQDAEDWADFGDDLLSLVNRIPIRIVNTTTMPVTLYQGTNMATAELIEEVSISGVTETDDSRQVPHDTNKKEVSMEVPLPAGLTELQKEKFLALLSHYADVMAVNSDDLGHTNFLTHRIETNEARPIRQQARRVPLPHRGKVQELLRDMLHKEVISPSTSPWASPIVLVRKKDGSTRFCVDY